MSILNPTEKRILNNYFVRGGYILDIETRQDARQTILDLADVDLFLNAYEDLGDSMGKRLKSFFSKGSILQIEKVISGLLVHSRHFLSDRDVEIEKKIEQIVTNLGGDEMLEKKFLSKEFTEVDFNKLSIEPAMLSIMQARWNEVKLCESSKAYLAAVIMTGSLLEGILLSVATQNPQQFNTAQSTPKDSETQKALQFHKWNLATLIEVSFECGWIDPDVKKHSHALRDFRNYVHPMHQKVAGFHPTKETLAISMQVFRASIVQIINKSKKL